MAHLDRKTARLRFGRLSSAGAYYFVTCCTKDRVRILTQQATAATVIEVLSVMDNESDIALTAATIMPDHIHLLFSLGDRLRIGQVIGKIKTLTSKYAESEWGWQEESFEHQVRLKESLEDYAFYIFVNPYRAGLCSLDQRWPWWVCVEPRGFQFLTHLESESPVPEEWIGRSKEVGDRIAVRR